MDDDVAASHWPAADRQFSLGAPSICRAIREAQRDDDVIGLPITSYRRGVLGQPEWVVVVRIRPAPILG